MFLSKKTFSNTPEFLKSEKYQNISCTVNDTGVTADEYGKKFALAGTLLDKDGNTVKITRSGSSGSYTYALSAAPAGILFDAVEVTHGPQPGALLIDGSVDAERLQGSYVVEAIQQLIAKMPFIKFFVDGQLQIKED
nr:MAG TPA: Head decoration protein [Caudoviricetes sp.]